MRVNGMCKNTATVSELVCVVQSTEWINLHLTALKVAEPALIFFAPFEQN